MRSTDERIRSWKLATWPVVSIMRAIYSIRFVGGENLPPEGGAVIAPNHLSPLDPFVVGLYPATHQRMLRFLSGTEFFAMRWVGKGLRALDHIPLERGKNDTVAIARATEVCRDGGMICLFPEGLINNTPDLLKLRRGAARIAAGAGVPLIPCGVWGTQVRFPSGGWTWRRPWRPRVVVVYGEPIPTDPANTSAKEILRLTNELTTGLLIARDRAKELAGRRGYAW